MKKIVVIITSLLFAFALFAFSACADAGSSDFGKPDNGTENGTGTQNPDVETPADDNIGIELPDIDL